MAGNVWEWVGDWYANSYQNMSVDNPTGSATGNSKVIRGGRWSSNSTVLRSSNRASNTPTNRLGTIGFRCAYPDQ
jgi:formylglycine-generating enzyme required for sulfatase activity